MTTSTSKTPEEFLRAIIKHLLRADSQAAADASWLFSILSADLQEFFRAEVLQELERKATRDGTIDPVKVRKRFYSLGGTAKAIFGTEYEAVKKKIDKESRAAALGEAH